MLWKNGLTITEQIKRSENWHIWFAWYPVIVGETIDHHYIRAWLQRVERKGTYVYEGLDYEYRLI